MAESSQGVAAPYAELPRLPWSGYFRLPLAMAALGRDGRIVAANAALHATVGQQCEPGTAPGTLVVPDDAALLTAAVERATTDGETVDVRVALRSRPDEKQEITITPVPPRLGVAAMLAMRDIRDQLRLEAQAAAATRMQAVGQLAGGIAHDFNNILTAVLGLTDQLLDRHGADDPDHEPLTEIRRNGRRAAAMIEQLLAFARQQPQRQELLDLATLVDGLRPLLAQLLGKGIELVIDSERLHGAVRADAGQIEQIIVNLAVNARDAMQGQGRLSIVLHDVAAQDIAALGHRIVPHAPHVAIAVTDTGSGIAPEIAGKIFEPFFTTKPMGDGTGLGLSTAYGIVKQSGGYIFARPAVPKGTVFSIYLPEVARPAEPPPPAPEAPPPQRAIAGLRLLLVEDEPAVRAVLARGLARHEIEVTAVADGAAALAALAGGLAADVLVSDVMMPGIDGVELAARVGRDHPGIAVVLMSGFAEPPLHRAADAQGVRFVAKPFALADLIAAIGVAQPANS